MKSKSLGLLLLFRVVCSAQEQFPQVDAIISDAVQTNLIPGAVLVVGHNGQIIYRKAYGSRSLIPNREPMTLDTIFDAASLTKVVATTPSIMKLFEQGKIRLDDPVTKYIPEFQGGQSDITIRLLMTHFSGFAPDFDMGSPWNGYAAGLLKALAEKPIAPPGSRFIYSDTNFILLGEIVQRLSGQTLADFAHDQIYAPLGMNETRFLPPTSLVPRIAPTEIDESTGVLERGVVNDPRSRAMGGVAGPGQICGDDARHGHVWRGANLRCGYGEEVHRTGKSGRSAHSPGTRLGYRFHVLKQSR